jgi:hypothetical protein
VRLNSVLLQLLALSPKEARISSYYLQKVEREAAFETAEAQFVALSTCHCRSAMVVFLMLTGPKNSDDFPRRSELVIAFVVPDLLLDQPALSVAGLSY